MHIFAQYQGKKAILIISLWTFETKWQLKIIMLCYLYMRIKADVLFGSLREKLKCNKDNNLACIIKFYKANVNVHEQFKLCCAMNYTKK